MAEQTTSKKRKIAQQSLKISLEVDLDKAHEVNPADFDKWHENVKKIFDTAKKEIAIESAKFKKSATFEPYDWRQVRIDTEPQ